MKNSASLDSEETNISTFLSAMGVSYRAVDPSTISGAGFDAAGFKAFYCRSFAEPVGFNNPTVLTKIRSAIESGSRLILENKGLYLAKYLGAGSVTESWSWSQAVLDVEYFVEPASPSMYWDSIPNWSPPTAPDNQSQMIARIVTRKSVTCSTLVMNNSTVSNAYFLLSTPGWLQQPTNTEYCQAYPGLCTSERSVHNSASPGTFEPQSTKIEHASLGSGRIYNVGIGLAKCLPTPNIAYGPVAAKIRENVLREALNNSFIDVTFQGTGSGTVNSIPSGVSCVRNCSASFPKDQSFVLMASPDWKSEFVGWGGACSGTACSVNLAADRAVTAEFRSIFAVRRLSNGALYPSIQEAYDATSVSETFQTKRTTFIEQLVFDKAITITLEGGRDDSFQNTIGSTTVAGSVVIGKGTVVFSNVVII